jgi:hypothetical protein
MARLGDLENALVSRLAEATQGGSPVFATVRGISGGYRSAIRDTLLRERTPAAYVAFLDESVAPETKTAVRGARFVVLLAARILRVGSNPRFGDVDSLGAFTLLDKARAQLDDYLVATGLRTVNVHEKFVEADERTAIYELLYRLWPIVEATLTFAGQALAGSASRMALEVGPLEVDTAQLSFAGLGGAYRRILWLNPRKIVWRGQLRASNDAAMNSIEGTIETVLAAQTSGNVADGTGRIFGGCVLDRFLHDGPRRRDVDGQTVIQDVELQFLQMDPP